MKTFQVTYKLHEHPEVSKIKAHSFRFMGSSAASFYDKDDNHIGLYTKVISVVEVEEKCNQTDTDCEVQPRPDVIYYSDQFKLYRATLGPKDFYPTHKIEGEGTIQQLENFIEDYKTYN